MKVRRKEPPSFGTDSANLSLGSIQIVRMQALETCPHEKCSGSRTDTRQVFDTSSGRIK